MRGICHPFATDLPWQMGGNAVANLVANGWQCDGTLVATLADGWQMRWQTSGNLCGKWVASCHTLYIVTYGHHTVVANE